MFHHEIRNVNSTQPSQSVSCKQIIKVKIETISHEIPIKESIFKCKLSYCFHFAPLLATLATTLQNLINILKGEAAALYFLVVIFIQPCPRLLIQIIYL